VSNDDHDDDDDDVDDDDDDNNNNNSNSSNNSNNNNNNNSNNNNNISMSPKFNSADELNMYGLTVYNNLHEVPAFRKLVTYVYPTEEDEVAKFADDDTRVAKFADDEDLEMTIAACEQTLNTNDMSSFVYPTEEDEVAKFADDDTSVAEPRVHDEDLEMTIAACEQTLNTNDMSSFGIQRARKFIPVFAVHRFSFIIDSFYIIILYCREMASQLGITETN